MFRSKAFCLPLILVALTTACTPGGAPGDSTGTSTSALPAIGAASITSGEAFSALPPGDILLTVDAGTLINQTIPAALATQPDQKAKFDKEMAEAQEKSGIDPKQLKVLAASITLPKTEVAKPKAVEVKVA